MRMCVPHWNELKAAISERGLDPFVSNSGEEAAKRTVAEFETDGARRETFDPLMAAYLMIVGNAIDAVGLVLMIPSPDGNDPCPICYIATNTPEGHPLKADIANWIKYAADGALEAMKKRAEDAPPGKG